MTPEERKAARAGVIGCKDILVARWLVMALDAIAEKEQIIAAVATRRGVAYHYLSWSKERPTAPGWYWGWRPAWGPKDEPQVLHLYHSASGVPVWEHMGHDQDSYPDEFQPDWLWAGPLTAPTDPQGAGDAG